MAADAALVQEFSAVVARCLHDTLGIDVLVSTASGCDLEHSILVSLSLGDAFCGPVTWRFERDIALELVRVLTADPSPTPEMAFDGATELANILTGSTVELFEAHGYPCTLGLPVLGGEHCDDAVGGMLATTRGHIEFQICAA